MAGIHLGAGNALRDLGLLSAGNVSQTGPIVVQSLLIQGGAASTVDLSLPGNQIGRLAFDPPRSFSVTAQGNLTIDAASALGCDAATGAFTPLALTNSQGGALVVLRAVGGDLLLNRSITMAGPGVTQLDLVSDRRFVAAPGAAITGPAAGQWRVWARTAADVDRGGLQGTNLYGCAFGDAAACSLSGIALPASGNHSLFVERPLLVVNADARTGVAGAPTPTLTYSVSGLANGDTAAGALAGTLAAPGAVRPVVYAINQGALTSPLGYRLQFLGADLTLARPSLTLPGNQKAPLHARFLPEQRSDVYGSNLSLPTICTATSMIRNDAGDGPSNDSLATEWGRVRGQPQLSGCLDVADAGRCDAF